jgi:hypothetical protein
VRDVPQSGANRAVDEVVGVTVRQGKRKERIMPEDYDRRKCAALVEEAREITDHLKAEAEPGVVTAMQSAATQPIRPQRRNMAAVPPVGRDRMGRNNDVAA